VVIGQAGGKTISAAAIRSAEGRGRAAEAAIFGLFVIGLAWVPFWEGSNQPAAWGINAVLFAGIAAIFEVLLLVRGEPHPVALHAIALPAALFALVISWIYVQTLTWPASPIAHPVWGMAADVLGRRLAGSVSVDRDLTNLALLRLITAALVFWSALQLCRNGAFARLLFKSIAGIGGAYAAYSLIAFSLPSARLPWLSDAAGVGPTSSTFFNRNSFAAYAGLGLIAVCGLGVQLYRAEVSARAVNLRLAVAAVIEAAGRIGAFVIGTGFLIAVALLLTGSRGGVIATGMGLVVLAGLTSRRGRRRVIPRAVLGVLACLAAAVLLLVFGDPVVATLQQRGLEDVNRLAVYLLTIGSIADRPIFGHGYGSFSDVFPMYRDRSISVDGVWLQAHDTYLELFQGLGLVFGSMLLAGVLLLVWRCVGGAMTRRENQAIPRAAAAAAVLVGVHSLVDFSLQIQAVTLTFASMLGAGVAQAKSSRAGLQHQQPSSSRSGTSDPPGSRRKL